MIDDDTKKRIEYELERTQEWAVARPDIAIARLIACVNMLLRHTHE